MATNRSLTSLVDYKIMFNGTLFMPHTTTCIPNSWTEQTLSTLPKSLILTDSPVQTEPEEAFTAPKSAPVELDQAPPVNQPAEPVDTPTDGSEISSNAPRRRR